MHKVINAVEERKFDDLQEAYILFTKMPKFDTSGFPDECKLQEKITWRLEEFAHRHFETEDKKSIGVDLPKPTPASLRQSEGTPILNNPVSPLMQTTLKKVSSNVSHKKSNMSWKHIVKGTKPSR